MIRKYFIAIATLLFLATSVLINGNTLLADGQGEIMEDRMVLEKKEGDCMVVNNRCYRVTEITTIKSRSGETISHSALPTPCLAKLTYYHNPKENIFEVISIEVLGDPSIGDPGEKQ